MTTEQETQLLEMLSAFQAGKRLSDLPSVSGNNPFDLLVEVLESGESKKAYLAQMLPYIEEDVSYGIEFDTTISSPTCTRIGNMSLHCSLPVQSRMRGCLLDDDGKVVEYLNPKDWGGNILDGSRGQVMVEMPDYYRKFETDGNKRRVRMSEYPLPGYHHVPKKYVSAYEATVQRTGNKLSSVVNLTADFRGGNNNADWDGTYRSLLGKPATNISRTNFRIYARNRKAGSTKWNCMTYSVHKDLYWMFVVEYATLNSQAAYNAQLTAEGYHQGGLGDGVTNLNGTAWSNYNGYYPFIPCGHTNSIGNGTGVVPFPMPQEYGTLTTNVPRYRGVENPFGHIWQWTDGINVQIRPDSDADPTSKVYVCEDPSKFNDSNYEGYHHVGNEARQSDSYVKEVIFGEEGDIMPTVVGGGSTIYFGDGHYTNIPAAVSLRGVLFGGAALGGATAGFAYANSSNAPSVASAHVGSRLCFIPE